MEQHFNDLTPAEQERLVILVEECAEVQAIAGKVLRHGYASYHPQDPAQTPNRILLERELGDLLFSARWVQEEDLDVAAVDEHAGTRLARVRAYTHHQDWAEYDLVREQMLAPIAPTASLLLREDPPKNSRIMIWAKDRGWALYQVADHNGERIYTVTGCTHWAPVPPDPAEEGPAAEPRTFVMQRQASGMQGAIFHGFVPPEDEQRRYVYKVVLRADDDRGLTELLDVWLSLRSVYGANGDIIRTK